MFVYVCLSVFFYFIQGQTDKRFYDSFTNHIFVSSGCVQIDSVSYRDVLSMIKETEKVRYVTADLVPRI